MASRSCGFWGRRNFLISWLAACRAGRAVSSFSRGRCQQNTFLHLVLFVHLSPTNQPSDGTSLSRPELDALLGRKMHDLVFFLSVKISKFLARALSSALGLCHRFGGAQPKKHVSVCRALRTPEPNQPNTPGFPSPPLLGRKTDNFVFSSG